MLRAELTVLLTTLKLPLPRLLPGVPKGSS